MTPKQKAKELVNRFRKEVKIPSKDYEKAKQCALICVNEVIKSLQRNCGYTQCKIDLEYYNEVKQEIEKL